MLAGHWSMEVAELLGRPLLKLSRSALSFPFISGKYSVLSNLRGGGDKKTQFFRNIPGYAFLVGLRPPDMDTPQG